MIYSIGNGQLHQIGMSQVCNTLDCMHDHQAILAERERVGMDSEQRYIVRRLTPKECGRLQGFPDDWCEDVQGSDAAQYKMWGNGCCLPCVLFVMQGVVQAAERDGMI